MDFSGNWYWPTSSNDPTTEKSQSRYAILYFWCSILWATVLQKVFTIYSTEAYYVSLSQLLRYLIHLLGLIKEFKIFGFEVFSKYPIAHYKAFEGNSGAIELARTTKIRPCMRHINSVFYNFMYYVPKGIKYILQVSTYDQCSDTWTKPPLHNVFLKHCKIIFGF